MDSSHEITIAHHISAEEKESHSITPVHTEDASSAKTESVSPSVPVRQNTGEKSVSDPDKLSTTQKFALKNLGGWWYTDELQLSYISLCITLGVVPSGYFLRNIKESTLSMKHCVLGAMRMKPILQCIGGNNHITSLDLTDAHLGDESVPELCNMFKENSIIKDVNLSENQLSSKCAENLCDVLASSTQLERIDLHGNKFCDKAGVYFSELMATSLRMSYLNLSYNNFGDLSTTLFGRALPQATSLIELDLGWNRLGSGGMRQFAKGLAENKNLEVLNLSYNGIGPNNGCRELALALKANKSLTVLDLSGNRISPEGAVLLSKGFYTNTTLLKIYLSENPLQTAGCYAILNGILKNANSGLQVVDLQGTLVNDDFRELQDKARVKLPRMTVHAGRRGTEQTRAISAKWSEAQVSPKEILQRIGRMTDKTLADALRYLDTLGEKRVTRQAFIQEIYKYLSRIGVDFAEEQVKILMKELDPAGEEEIDFSIFERSLQVADTPN